MPHLLGRLAHTAATHWKRSLAVVGAVLVALVLLSTVAGGEFSDDFKTPGTESQAAIDVLTERFPAQAGDTATLVFSVADGTLRDGGRPAAIEQVVGAVARHEHVSSAVSPLSRAGAGQLSKDGRIGFVTVQYDAPAGELGTEAGEALVEVGAPAERAGIDVSRRGQIVDQAEQATTPVGELIGVGLAVILLTVVFRSFAAMAITLVSALVALMAGVLLLTLASRFTSFPSFAPTLGVMLGLGAGIDYALLIVGRYREQLAAGDDVAHAARVANATAGTSVVAAGVIVVVAISGLLAVGIPFVGRMGVGSAIVVACVAVGAITVLPPLMGAAAKRLRPRKLEHVAPSPLFARWATWLTARPWRSAAAGTLVLLVLATPFTALRLGQPDDGNDKAEAPTRQAYDKLAEGFGPGFNGPLVLSAAVGGGGDGKRDVERVERAVRSTPGVAAVSPVQFNRAGDAATLTVIPATSPQDQRTADLVERLRSDVLPGAVTETNTRVYVGGAVATLRTWRPRSPADCRSSSRSSSGCRCCC